MSSLLKSHAFQGIQGPLLTVVMDGIGLSDLTEGNAVYQAHTPTLDHIFNTYGSLSLAAHGTAVGLPSQSDMGNSEVGHNALGAGRIFEQGASLVQSAIQEETLFASDTWKWLIEGSIQSQTSMHWIGLLSDGNVHSHEMHLHAMVRRAAQDGVQRGRVHILLDGRDVSETSALLYIERLETVLSEINQNAGYDYRIASGGGRMTTTMDRYEADWGMVEQGWKTHVLGQAPHYPSATVAIQSMRQADPDVIDQFLPSFVIADEDGPIGRIEPHSSVCFFNFRGDRAIEISRAFCEKDWPYFEREWLPVRYAGMMQYDGDLKIPQHFLVQPPVIERSMGEYLSYNGVGQFACSETQKFGHVTYFWNGNRSGAFDHQLESYVEIDSDTCPFEQRPWMKAAEITDATLQSLATGQFRYGRINFANGDMVGHTGDFQATKLSVEILDLALGRLLKGIEKLGGVALITADHGNAEQMYERNKKNKQVIYDAHGKPKALTSHTLNPVPLCLFDPLQQVPAHLSTQHVTQAGLANVAATSLELLGFQAPEEYQTSLLHFK